MWSLFCVASALLALCPVYATELVTASFGDVILTCQLISQKVSNASAVVYPIDPSFTIDIEHWIGSSSQISTCVVEVGSAEDTGFALQIIAASNTPFAVKSGGHTGNQGFSSTTGVHISFARMTQVTFSDDKSTVELGMGLTWAQVYELMQDSGYNVVGGRVPGPGVGGFSLGGGYSWKTNQFGLTSDTIESYTLVLPNGTVSTISSSQPDLFWALKGGLNRFGIVTSAVYRTHEQPPLIYGGISVYNGDQIPTLINATDAFYRQNTDSKASIFVTVFGNATLGTTTASVFFFYDGPTRPTSFEVFDAAVPTVSTVTTQTFSSFVQSIPSSLDPVVRGHFDGFSVSSVTPTLLNAVKNESDYWGSMFPQHSGSFLEFAVEPFQTSFGELAVDSAYPHSDSPLPYEIFFQWLDGADDEFWLSAAQSTIATLTQVAMDEGIYDTTSKAYPNYASASRTVEELYGDANSGRLRAIMKQVDPDGVMDLTGGFSF
ncbi:hypothetical protein MMC10_006811 [Thelotrema lepadinum]|nr:hypothetical protein [Thelotrema lepadinum]